MGLLLTQSKYAIKLLQITQRLESKSCKTPIAARTKLLMEDSDTYVSLIQYKNTIGALQYLTMTKPDISFAVNKLSQFLKEPTKLQWQVCKRLLRYIKGTQSYELLIRPAQCLSIKAFTDADQASYLCDIRSTNGLALYVGSNLVQQGSRNQKMVALSSTKVEYKAINQASIEVTWLRSLLTEIKIPCFGILVIWCDNTSIGSLASNVVLHSRIKHIEINILFLKEQVITKKLKVQYVPTQYQTVDILTKALSVPRFEELKRQLCVVREI